MYLDYWQLTEFPFDNGSNQEFYYESEKHRHLTDSITDAIMRHKGVIALTGDIGCGKTTLSQHVLLGLPDDRFDIILITYPRLSPLEMLSEIATQMDIPTEGKDKITLIHAIQKHLIHNMESDRDTIICIDEAQSIPSMETFEELRLLLNFQFADHFILTLFFVGQPELADQFKALPQLEQRIALHLNLGAMDMNEAIRYILKRLQTAGCRKAILTKQAAMAIHHLTKGIPRRINHLADYCLLTGMQMESPIIDRNLVAETFKRYSC